MIAGKVEKLDMMLRLRAVRKLTGPIRARLKVGDFTAWQCVHAHLTIEDAYGCAYRAKTIAEGKCYHPLPNSIMGEFGRELCSLAAKNPGGFCGRHAKGSKS